jgi:hypothetical protein
MAAGWPTKVTYANGDVYSASDVNDTNGTLNYIDPTAATDRQVLTRDNASAGKVKWVNSPANTLTTTGDLYYASGANTPARLGIGSTSQVLTVVGGVPAWSTGGGAMTSIASGTLSGASLDLTSIPASYNNLYLVLQNPYQSASGFGMTLRVNNISSANYYQSYNLSAATTSVNQNGNVAMGIVNNSFGVPNTATKYWGINISIPNYTSTTSAKEISYGVFTGTDGATEVGRGYCNATGAMTSAISRLTVIPGSSTTFSGGTYVLYGVK